LLSDTCCGGLIGDLVLPRDANSEADAVLRNINSLRSEHAFIITCVANLMEVKVFTFHRICGMKFLVTGVSMF
jgi:hypothetical protein